MFGIELYNIFLLGAGIILGGAFAYLAWNRFEVAIISFTFSSFAAAVFYNNIEDWRIEEVATGIGGYLRGGLLLFAGLMGIVYYIKTFRQHNGRIPLHFLFLFIFLLISIGSTYYSIDSNNTFVRSSLFITLAMFLLGLDTWLDEKEKFVKLLNILFGVVSLLIVLNFIAIFIAPARVWWWKTPSRFLGLWSHPNEAGGFNLIAYPIIFWKLTKTKGNYKFVVLFILLLNIVLHLLTGSRTSLLVSLIGVFIWLIIYKDWLKIIVLSLGLAVAAIVLSQVKISSFQRGEGSKITDLTERENIWNGAIIFAKEKPFAGYGYAVESKIFANQNLYDLSSKHLDINAQSPLHNGYLSIFIGGGAIGLLIWLITLGIPIYFALSSDFSPFKAYALATLIPILISNFVESALTGYLSITDIYFWLAWTVAGSVWILETRKDISKLESDDKHLTSQKEILQSA